MHLDFCVTLMGYKLIKTQMKIKDTSDNENKNSTLLVLIQFRLAHDHNHGDTLLEIIHVDFFLSIYYLQFSNLLQVI